MSWSLKEEQEFAARNGKGGPSWENRGKGLEEGGRSGPGATQATNQTKSLLWGTSSKHTTRCIK